MTVTRAKLPSLDSNQELRAQNAAGCQLPHQALLSCASDGSLGSSTPLGKTLCDPEGSNLRPLDLHTSALPPELGTRSGERLLRTEPMVGLEPTSSR